MRSMPINAKYAVFAFLTNCRLLLKALFDPPEIDLVLGPTLLASSNMSFWKSLLVENWLEIFVVVPAFIVIMLLFTSIVLRGVLTSYVRPKVGLH